MPDAQQSTDSSAGPSATERLSAGHRSIRVPLRVMLDVQDELTDLAAALGCLTGIRSILRVMGEVGEPAEALRGKPSADRIGTAAAELFEASLDEYPLLLSGGSPRSARSIAVRSTMPLFPQWSHL